MTVTSRNSVAGAENASPNISAAFTDPAVKQEQNIQAKNPGGLGIRHLQTLLMFFGLTIAYMLRVNMSVAIVAMSNSTTANPEIQDFGWSSKTQSYILSSFFWGYVITQIPAGQIAHRWSATKLWAFCMFTCGIVNILIPVAATIGDGWMAVCACRVIMGLSQGCVLPCVHTLLGKWVPPHERGRLGTYSYAGAQFGTVIGLPVSGWLAASSIGWPSAFYLVGAITIAWAIAMFIWGADSPALHRSIKSPEKNYIEESLGQVDVKEHLPTPWLAIITSIPVWSLVIVHCGQNWGYWMLLTEIPTYMSSILSFDISKNGLMSALPYLAMWLLSFPLSWSSDYVQTRGWLSRGATRKLANSIGHWGPALALLGLGYVTSEHTVIAVVVLVFSVGLNAGSLCGYQVNHIDLSPNFAGTLMAITNCIANIMSILAPLIAGVIVVDTSDITQWRTVFFISAAIYLVCNLVFIIFGRGEVQWWNEPKQNMVAENGKNVNHGFESDKSDAEAHELERKK